MKEPLFPRSRQMTSVQCGSLPQTCDTIKVVGMGSAGMDYLAEVSSFPKPDQKMRTENFELQGGGNCGNALTAVARLGLKPVIVSKIGSDSVGDAIVSEFEEDGVNTKYLLRSESGKSPFTYIIVDRETNTRTCIHTPGEPFREDEMTAGLVKDILDQASVVYFDGRLAEAAAILAKGARERGIPVLVEAERLRPGLDVLLEYADFVVTSAYFPRDFTGKTNIDEAMISMSMQLPHVKWIATTLGSKGALLLESSTKEEALEDPIAVHVSDEKLVIDLFNEAKTIREASQNTSTRSSVNAGALTIHSRSIASSGVFYLDGSGPLDKAQSEEERSIAQQAAMQAALMNADSKNAKGYQGKSNLKSDATDCSVCYYLTAIESADIPSDQIVDTTGAGDAFIGSMVYSVAMGMPPIKGCELGSLVAACKCTMLGARPGLPTMDSIHLH
eukprot:jgi/Picsp_1/1176/NSC_04657-R1_-type carbohydrate kinase